MFDYPLFCNTFTSYHLIHKITFFCVCVLCYILEDYKRRINHFFGAFFLSHTFLSFKIGGGKASVWFIDNFPKNNILKAYEKWEKKNQDKKFIALFKPKDKWHHQQQNICFLFLLLKETFRPLNQKDILCNKLMGVGHWSINDYNSHSRCLLLPLPLNFHDLIP